MRTCGTSPSCRSFSVIPGETRGDAAAHFSFMSFILPAILLALISYGGKSSNAGNTMKKMMMFLAVAVVLPAASFTASGHHSFAMFDQTRKVTIEGVVAEVQWTNPHVWVEVDVLQDDGTSVRWGIEFTSVVHLLRRGMTMNTVRVGDAVEFSMSPYADGSPGGRFYWVKLPSGEYYCDVGAAQQVCQENN